ncbi:hypothetical protein NEMBOFW57_002851 [Staphylotrichum longicolle]|uniref:Uncharacterized protein n=1 Tax=Staphylotrichum longicolle TaxID=669026 RepID=A0AAD4F6T3_9PEZI|nr:hypothetical protein NEMBOFW57_002851 [Staphylotrichum longicolle]
MADTVPAALRQADINIWKCATKAAQLQTVKPIMAYWCEYWAVNQILAKQLHTTDESILHYTTNLMDKLEQTKAEYANEDAITDDTAGQAYVEQFAQETLDRAERVVKANRVTQQTATTFDAAATFFHVANVWGPVDQETQQKIKYAKWNAARIVKAIKEGVDPNESNPKHEEAPPPELDPTDPAVQSLGGVPPSAGPRPATVEDAPDADLRDAAGVSLPQSPVSAGPSPMSEGGLQLPGVPTDLSPPADTGAAERVDAFASEPGDEPSPDGMVTTSSPRAGYAPVQSGGFTADEAAMAGAQKHAKWAISALNFEDVPTAVRELRRALELLGAT